ncbi:UDP-N-acetylglucosamine acyltransferase [Segatella copri]|nr:UDP-N-acetylglucosamine acyltransferase [Segatella copri]
MNQISPLAFVHPEAKLGDNNIIGPFCYIDKDTVLGDNNVRSRGSRLRARQRLDYRQLYQVCR